MWSFEAIINLQNATCMRGLAVPQYLIAYIIANVFALTLLFLSWKQPRVARALFSFLFIWACYTNWHVALTRPNDYMFYANLALLDSYKDFIYGWFSNHILLVVGAIATCQGLIAVAFLLRGWIYALGSVGAITFLMAIAPLGVGAAFPCTVILSVAVYLLLKENPDYLWIKHRQQKVSHAY